MILANIRGTRAQLRALAGAKLRHYHDGLRRINKTQFELPAVLEEADANLVTATGAELVVLGDLQELLSARLARPAISAPSFTSPQSLLDSVAKNSAYLPAAFIESWIAGLAGLFPQWCTAILLPNKTWEGRTVTAVRVRAGDSTRRPAVLFTSGLHAAELGGPDICVYFLYHLLNAYVTQSAITLGETIFPMEHVQDIVGQLDVVVLPCVNPDGRVYVETIQVYWRKNRNQGAGDGAIGVDINRNFDFLWSSGIGSSGDPSADTYRGTAAFSEPETRNVQWLLEAVGADVYVDLHGPSQTLVYPWGYAPDQSVNPGMSFLNPAWDGKRTLPYQEYINAGDAAIYQALGQKMVDATNQVRGSSYTAGQSYETLYPTTATSDDYTYSRNLVDTSKKKSYAFTFEYGGGTWFPEYSEMQQVAAEVNAGMIALCDALVARAL